MSTFNADKSTGLAPNKTTRFQLADARMSQPQVSQSDREKAMFQKNGTGKPFGRVGIVGPR